MKKTALVTGASSGIGESTAIALATAGYTVYAGARRIERMEHLKSEGIIPVSLDVTDDRSMKEIVSTIIKQTGTIDILVNNAGYGSFGAVEDVPPEEAHRQLDVNLFGLIRLTQLVLPYMRKQHFGKIVNITSIGGKMATPFGGWYHASKFAVEGISDSLRNEVRQFGIDVIIIEPGGIKTEWGGIAMNSLEKYSGSTAYGQLAQKAQSSTAGSNGSEPKVISDLIIKVISIKRPKARYHAGHMSWIVSARRLLPDSLFDKLIMSKLK